MKRAWWTLGCGGASLFGTLLITRGPSRPAAIAAFAVAVAACHMVAELCSALPAIITALSAKRVARIKARTGARLALEGARRSTALVNAGLDGKLDAALSLLKLQLLDAQAPAGRRLSEDMLRELLPGPRVPHEEDARLAVIQPRQPAEATKRP